LISTRFFINLGKKKHFEMAKYKSEHPWQRTFHKYFTEILSEKPFLRKDPGPYVSIARDFGCTANPLAKKLSAELTKINMQRGIKKEWNWINKEILEASAKELGLKTSEITYVFRSQQKSTIDEIVSALSSKYYQSDRKIRKTITEVIKSLLSDGNIVIVGRGGVAFTQHIPRSLHIKLKAPLEWRINRISKNYNLSHEEAKKIIKKVDKERKALVETFLGKTTDETIFDIIYNRETMTEAQIIKSVICVMESKKLI